jgi:lipoprotein-anchoring transpeptidase ErfK/SrfK
MNLTGDGVAIHGSNVRWGWGTNGCVGLPVEFAKMLFAQMNVGDKVVIVKGKTPAAGQSVPLV